MVRLTRGRASSGSGFVWKITLGGCASGWATSARMSRVMRNRSQREPRVKRLRKPEAPSGRGSPKGTHWCPAGPNVGTIRSRRIASYVVSSTHCRGDRGWLSHGLVTTDGTSSVTTVAICVQCATCPELHHWSVEWFLWIFACFFLFAVEVISWRTTIFVTISKYL